MRNKFLRAKRAANRDAILSNLEESYKQTIESINKIESIWQMPGIRGITGLDLKEAHRNLQKAKSWLLLEIKHIKGIGELTFVRSEAQEQPKTSNINMDGICKEIVSAEQKAIEEEGIPFQLEVNKNETVDGANKKVIYLSIARYNGFKHPKNLVDEDVYEIYDDKIYGKTIDKKGRAEDFKLLWDLSDGYVSGKEIASRLATPDYIFASMDKEAVSPPHWKGTVKHMEKHKEIDNPYALAWYMKNKGDKPHFKDPRDKKKHSRLKNALDAMNKELGAPTYDPRTEHSEDDAPFYSKGYDHRDQHVMPDPKEAAIEQHSAPKKLPPRDDLRRHKDTKVENDLKNDPDLKKDGKLAKLKKALDNNSDLKLILEINKKTNQKEIVSAAKKLMPIKNRIYCKQDRHSLPAGFKFYIVTGKPDLEQIASIMDTTANTVQKSMDDDGYLIDSADSRMNRLIYGFDSGNHAGKMLMDIEGWYPSAEPATYLNLHKRESKLANLKDSINKIKSPIQK